MKAWYFSNMDCRLRYGDDREIKAGITHAVQCEPILCEQGLHASIRPIDAIEYAPGPYVWRVELTGQIARGDDKVVATQRTYLWGYDASMVLRKYACLCALDVLPDDAPKIVREYLLTQDESKRDAARYAARDAARYAAREKQNRRLYRMLMGGPNG